ncbi:sensor histidine kinase [Paenibacillus wynnii]|uniref:Histidine kinase/HSP90-like ATPase domain-containing protein n=1 Tax=Paenibacillus wynnii TaxID=268407 RepID=A0A098MCV5_9BACL|nr:ATP-binding protein [Paenibacillus wynnii]KGE19801.1 hypothetical protein PWYN_10965 [Paenibacillus wynnii]
MINKRWISFILFNALLLFVCVVYFSSFNTVGFASDVVFTCLLTGVGTVVYLNTSAVPSAKWFIVLMYMTAWILLLLNGPSRFYFGIGRVFMSLAPNVLFIFFIHFTNLPLKRLYYKLSSLLLLSALATSLALLSFRIYLSYAFFFHLLFAAFCCGWISIYYNFKQRKILSRDRMILNVSIAISFMPFVITNTFLRQFLPDTIKLYSIYTLIALPVAVGYILIKRNGLQTSIDGFFLGKLALLALAGTSLFLSFSLYVIRISLIRSLLLLLVAYIIFYCYLLFQRHLSTRQLYILTQTKEKLEKERLEILQKMTYDHYLSTLSNLIKQFIDKTISLNGTLIIWVENNRSYILEQSGIFEHFSLKKFDQSQLKERIDTITFEQKSCFSFPLKYKKIVNGWLITGQKSDKDKFTSEDMNTMIILADTICEILKTTEILHESQRRYVHLPNIRYEDYLNVSFVQKVEGIRKSLALYLHDDILQSILAMRNMTEALQTPQRDIQELILNTFSDLNTSIRDKMFDIYPTTLTDLGLYQSLGILCKKLNIEAVQQPDLKIRLESDYNLEVDKELQYTVFRTVKELLQNAIKHAEASEIIISLKVSDIRILLIDVIDDGKGFDIGVNMLEEKLYTNHIGLLSAKQEINTLHGEFSIKSNLLSGTHIQIKIPMKGTGEEYAHHVV